VLKKNISVGIDPGGELRDEPKQMMAATNDSSHPLEALTCGRDIHSKPNT
jgi:hypothetical protein